MPRAGRELWRESSAIESLRPGLLNARKTFFFPLDRLSIKYIEFVNYYAMSLIGPRGRIAKW
jgi:hypothetical protein